MRTDLRRFSLQFSISPPRQRTRLHSLRSKEARRGRGDQNLGSMVARIAAWQQLPGVSETMLVMNLDTPGLAADLNGGT